MGVIDGSCLLSFISFLHQTTTGEPSCAWQCHCLLSLFYIKPQHDGRATDKNLIVFYLFSTSNHNLTAEQEAWLRIVFYLFSTSNHNVYFITCLFISICYTYVIHEVANFDAFLCKITKKILSVMGLAWIFSPRIPIYE